MAYGKRLLPEALRSSAFGAIGAAYTAIGTAFAHPIRIFLIQNLTDQTVLIRWVSGQDNMIVPANGFVLLDVMCNKANDGGTFIAENTIIYVKHNGVAPTVGAVYVSVFFCLGD
jgi:hypothetical protein